MSALKKASATCLATWQQALVSFVDCLTYIYIYIYI